MSVSTVNWDALEWEEFSTGVRFGGAWADLSRRLGLRKLGCGAWIVAPGRTSAPYHAHFVNEEMALVLGGELVVRLDGVEHPLIAGDVVAFPPGADSAHQFLNRGERPAHLFLASTMEPHDYVEYPDSGKRLYQAGDAPDAAISRRVFVRGGRALEASRDGLEGLEGESVDEPLGPPQDPPAARSPRIVNLAGVPWEGCGSGPFSAERKRLGRAAGARLLGYSLYRLRPAERPWPYHFHHVNEEFFYVRSGYGRLRSPDGERELRPGDAFGCPGGPEGAHSIVASDAGSLEYLALSTMESPEVSEHPDSGKIYVMVGAPPGGEKGARSVDLVFRRADAVDYLDGERAGG